MRSTTAAAFLRCSLLVGLVAASAASFAQARPVTVAEANAVFDRIDASIRKVLKLPVAKPSTDRATRPVTRAEVVERMHQLFASYRPKFAYTPRPFRAEPGEVAKANKDPKTVERINTLVRWGCVGPVGPLAVGPADTLTTEQFGDAVGYFMSQIAALTYYADPNWTPVIQPPD